MKQDDTHHGSVRTEKLNPFYEEPLQLERDGMSRAQSLNP